MTFWVGFDVLKKIFFLLLIFDSVWCECLEKLSSDLFMFYTKPADTTFTSHKAAVLKYWNIEQQEFEILKAMNIKSKQK